MIAFCYHKDGAYDTVSAAGADPRLTKLVAGMTREGFGADLKEGFVYGRSSRKPTEKEPRGMDISIACQLTEKQLAAVRKEPASLLNIRAWMFSVIPEALEELKAANSGVPRELPDACAAYRALTTAQLSNEEICSGENAIRAALKIHLGHSKCPILLSSCSAELLLLALSKLPAKLRFLQLSLPSPGASLYGDLGVEAAASGDDSSDGVRKLTVPANEPLSLNEECENAYSALLSLIGSKQNTLSPAVLLDAQAAGPAEEAKLLAEWPEQLKRLRNGEKRAVKFFEQPAAYAALSEKDRALLQELRTPFYSRKGSKHTSRTSGFEIPLGKAPAGEAELPAMADVSHEPEEKPKKRFGCRINVASAIGVLLSLALSVFSVAFCLLHTAVTSTVDIVSASGVTEGTVTLVTFCLGANTLHTLLIGLAVGLCVGLLAGSCCRR